MKNTFLPFQIGEQYQMWEFDLNISEVEKLKGCDSYYYNRNISFGGVKPDRVELIFCLDILQVVIITFTNCLKERKKSISKMMEHDFQKRGSKILNKEIYIISQNIEI